MMKKIIQFLLAFFLVLSIEGCASKDVHAVFQSDGASIVRGHTIRMQKLLLAYYTKLNKHNPSYTTKIESIPIVYDIKNRQNNATLVLLNDKKDASYKDYLNIAFSRDNVKNRNDYLVAGISKMLYWAYSIERSHTLTTMQYDAKKMQEAYQMLQVIQYRIENEKDVKGQYLFTTWQNKWQLDVLKGIYTNKKVDVNKYEKEELMRASNMEFRIISEGMLFTLEESLKYLGEESGRLGISAIKNVFIFF